MRKIVLIIAGIVGLFTLAESCRKPNFIGEELLPEEDFLNSERSDTFQVITYTVPDDSVVTSQNVFYTMGSINSPVYGKSTASIYTQLLLPSNNLNFGTTPDVDSIILTLDYAGYYGDLNSTHSVSVYRMNQVMEKGRLYYSDSKFKSLPFLLGSKNNFTANLTDSVELGNGVKYEPHLRIKLQNLFGENIISDTASLENDTTFLRLMKGLYIQTDTSSGYGNGMMYFDMASSLSGVTIYYHNAEADSLVVTFPFSGVKTNHFTHSYPVESEVYNSLAETDTIIGEPLSYVQGLGGLKTVVKLPTIGNMEDISINKAELTLYVQGTTGDFLIPPKLMLVQLDSTGRNYYYIALYTYEIYSSIIDDNFGSTDIGGAPTKIIDRFGKTSLVCRYNITRHVQEIIEGSIDNNGFALICIPGNRIANSVTLSGSNCLHPAMRPYLTITYTTVNK